MKTFKLKGKIVFDKEDYFEPPIKESEISGGYFTSKKYNNNLSVMGNIKRGNELKSLENKE